MTQTILTRRSDVPGKVPTTQQLSLGEIALNVYDGKLFFKQSADGMDSIVDLGFITISGDVSGSGNRNLNLTLSNTGVTPGIYRSVIVDPKGRVLQGFNPTTISEYGITDAAPLSHVYDETVHLTTAQNDWIDAITATSAEVNYLSGITSSVQTQLDSKQGSLGYTPENVANKGAVNGYASLGSDGKVPAAQLPSYVDDVLEYADLASLPGSGETGKIYVTIDSNKIYRWTGSAYIEISPTVGNSDTATKLSTARTIALSGDVTGSVSFDGSSNVTIAATIAADSVALGTDTTGNYVSTISAGTSGSESGTSGLTISSVAGEGTAATLALSNTGITAGTYRSITVDAKGRATAGSNPTTLAEYGITDAYTKSTIDAMTIDGGVF